MDFRIAPAACYDTEYKFMPNGKTKITHNYHAFTVLPREVPPQQEGAEES